MSVRSSTVLISEGRSYAYLAHSFFLTATIVAGSFFFPIILILLVMPIALFLATTGVEFDNRKKRVRTYVGILNWRKGIWLPLAHFESAVLTEYRTGNRSLGMRRYGYTSSKTYDVVLTAKTGEEFELNDFMDYHKALECLNVLGQFGIQIRNLYAEKTTLVKMRRKGRR